jgi:hypothetical protein
MPNTFYLEESAKSKFLANFDPGNPRYDLIKNMYVFSSEMSENMALSRRRPLVFWLTTNDTLEFFKKLCWLIGFVINIIVVSTYKLNEVGSKDDMGERRLSGDMWETGIRIASFCFAAITLILLCIWIKFKMTIEYRLQLMMYWIKHPSLYLQEPDFSTKAHLLINKTILEAKHATNFFFHIVFALLGTYSDPFFHTLHLLLWFNISAAANYIL